MLRSLALVLTLAVAPALQGQAPPRSPRPAPRAKPAKEPRLVWPAQPPEPETPVIWELLPERPFALEAPFLLEAPFALETPLPHVAPLAPEARLALPVEPEWSLDADFGLHDAPLVQGKLAWHRSGLVHQEPQDSLYRRARDLLNRGEYRRSADLFERFEQKNPTSRYAAAAMFWRAFALYRAGTEADMRLALRVLDEQRQRFSVAANDQDVAALVARVNGALASRGDAEAARRLREGAAQGVQACDREDMEVRAEALSALVQTDPNGAADVLRRILARRDECTVTLRRRAVYLLGRDGNAGAAAALVDAAKHDPSPYVKSDAIARLAQIPGPNTIALLEELLNQTTDEVVQRAVLQSLRRVDDAAVSALLRRMIDREDLSETVRAEAIRSLGRASWGVAVATPRPAGEPLSVVVTPKMEARLSDVDASFLRSLYGRTTSRNLRHTILETIARNGGATNDQWLMGIVRDQNEELRYRSAALGRLRRSDVSIEELSRLYDSLTERELRSTLVSILGSREEPAATDKLIEIAKSGTDPSIRRAAISALARKNDPRATKLLLELVEK
jgi:HEAT repeat protein